jgi:FlaA1/EpsC-like NDP-sugar epimerase
VGTDRIDSAHTGVVYSQAIAAAAAYLIALKQQLVVSRRTKLYIVHALYMLIDSVAVVVAYYAALQLRFGTRVPPMYLERLPMALVGLVSLQLAANELRQLYWRGWRYAGLQDALALVGAVCVGMGLAFVVIAGIDPSDHMLPLSVVPIAAPLTLLLMGLPRFRTRVLRNVTRSRARAPLSRTLIVGAGQAGQRLARELLSIPELGYRPVCLVDDDPGKRWQRVHGLLVAGGCDELEGIARSRAIDTIVVAIPSLSVERRRDIIAYCHKTGARVKIVPGLPELLTGSGETLPLRDPRLEELLGRPAVDFMVAGRARWWDSQTSVLITGAAGSIGSELARQVARAGVGRVILVDNNESGLFDIAAEVCAQTDQNPDVKVAVCDVTRLDRVLGIFRTYQPDAVFHAAAYKHVPLMEAHPAEAVMTNVVGTCNVCEAASRHGCERVVFVSTDKAVDPVNIMGATKWLGEQIVCSFAAASSGIYCAVRFGNVLGSRGSVVPIFERQIRAGGPVTVTHREATRFFMTIPEAASLVIEASCHAEGGEVFILDMGERVRIVDLATKMIRLHGLRPEIDIAIVEVGLRPGEKLHESLTTRGEDLAPTAHPRVSRVRRTGVRVRERRELLRSIGELTVIAEQADDATVAAALFGMLADPPALPALAAKRPAAPRNGITSQLFAAPPRLAPTPVVPDSAA